MKKKKRKRPTDLEIDKARCHTAYRDVGTLALELETWVQDLVRFKADGWKINHRELLLESLLESRRAVNALMRELR
jgi:hypothetical protein